MTHRFEDFCNVYLGFKSFLNDFFYVDRERIERFGIEQEYLRPVYKLGDLDEEKYMQDPPEERWLFVCKKEPVDLRGSGAWRYISWGAQQETKTRKQTKAAVKWSESPALQGQRYWFWLPAPLHPSKLAIRKGIGIKYAPFLFKKAAVLDQRLYLLFPKEGVPHRLMAAYIASSFFPLALETNADMGLGAGVLTYSTDGLRELPVLNLEAIAKSKFSDDVVEACERLFKTRPPDAFSYPVSTELRLLDEAILKASGLTQPQAQAVSQQVSELARARVSKSQLRRVARLRVVQQDIERVVKHVAKALDRWLIARRFPEDYFGREADSVKLVFPHSSLYAEAEVLLGRTDLRIVNEEGQLFYHEEIDSNIAELIVRALQMGRRDFNVPTQPEEAYEALRGLDSMIREFRSELEHALQTTGMGIRYEDAIRGRVLEVVGMPIHELTRSFDTGTWSINEPSRS